MLKIVSPGFLPGFEALGEPEALMATALDADGKQIGTGYGRSMTEALRTVIAREQEEPAALRTVIAREQDEPVRAEVLGSESAAEIPDREYSDEPPFERTDLWLRCRSTPPRLPRTRLPAGTKSGSRRDTDPNGSSPEPMRSSTLVGSSRGPAPLHVLEVGGAADRRRVRRLIPPVSGSRRGDPRHEIRHH
ncbi:hypothetical protein Misp01_47440 [Microtetraspora sp. NBRC 13810]|nr:hypothetical protein Misp01_47440 [Microtetraspora sp. NBRC 13810]